MIKEAKFLILLMIFSETNSFAQQLSSQVLLPAAGVASSGQINYSQSIGETAVEVFSTSDYILKSMESHRGNCQHTEASFLMIRRSLASLRDDIRFCVE
jgi:hypothetical protein